MSEYFICQSCGNVQHTTEFGECAECGQESLFPIDGVVKELLAPYIQQIASKYNHNIEDDKAQDLALTALMNLMGVIVPNVIRSHMESEERTPEYRKGIFLIDDADISYDGYTTGQTWNGWACPFFTREVAEKMVENYNIEAHFLKAWYDEEKDAFSFEMRENSPEETDTFEGFDITVDGETKHVYAVGAGSWVWEEVREDARTPEKQCEHLVDDRNKIRVNRGIELAELEYCVGCGKVLGETTIESYL